MTREWEENEEVAVRKVRKHRNLMLYAVPIHVLFRKKKHYHTKTDSIQVT
jgi:hypothetical protein